MLQGSGCALLARDPTKGCMQPLSGKCPVLKSWALALGKLKLEMGPQVTQTLKSFLIKKKITQC